MGLEVVLFVFGGRRWRGEGEEMRNKLIKHLIANSLKISISPRKDLKKAEVDNDQFQ